MTWALLLAGLAWAGEADEAPPAEPDAAEAPAEAPPAPAVDPRDAEIFGPPAADPRDAEVFGPAADDRDAEIFGPAAASPPPDMGGPLKTNAEIAAKLAAQDRRFTVGGSAYLRLDGAVAEGDDASTAGVSSGSFMDLFGDARPNDRLRLYARGRVYHDVTVGSDDVDFLGEPVQQTRVVLDQLWLNLDVAHKVFVTAGRQRVKWGVGRLWNPTDFLAPGVLDSLAVIDERLGVGLIKVHVPFETTNTNVYVLAALEGARHPDEIGGALRIEQLLGPAELALTGTARKDQSENLGAQLSFPLWLFDLKAEAALRHGIPTPMWEGSYDLTTLALPTELDRSGDWVPQVLAGAELGLRYSDEDSLYLGGEYLFNDLGYAGASLYPWLIAQGQFQPFYLGRHYVAAYVLAPGLGRSDEHTLSATAISNLSDETVLGRLDWSVRVLTELTFNAYGQVHGGLPGGEFAFALEVEPIPGVLEDGLSVPKPLFDLGIGAQLRF
jgi:hypothetical protein